MANTSYRAHGLQNHIPSNLGPNGLSRASKTRVFEIKVPQIVIHKADQPNSVLHFLDADRLAGEGGAEVNLLVAQAALQRFLV
jgi:hypothetical protein